MSTSDEFTELSARCEALSRLVLHLIVHLEDRKLIEPRELHETLRSARPLGAPPRHRHEELIDELLQADSEARALRRRRRIEAENLEGPSGSRS